MPQTVDSTLDALGSHLGIRRAVGQFFDRTSQDRLLTNYFAGERADEMRHHLVALLSAALADQQRPTQLATVRTLSLKDMAREHHDLKITDTAFDRVLGHLNAAFVEAGTDDGTSRRVLVALSGVRTDIVSA